MIERILEPSGHYIEALEEEGLESAKRTAELKCERMEQPWSEDAF